MQNDTGDTPLGEVLAYHQRTKHHLNRYAASLGYLDWATQPNPFRRFEGSRLVLLDEVPPVPAPEYDEVLGSASLPAHAVDRASISQLFYDSLALSAWKAIGSSRWSLRVNPSSGNLHPTEGYLVSGPIPGLLDRPAVCHYAPFEHGIEIRRELADEDWTLLTEGLPAGAFFVALTSIFWRESWKYGERAYRYCQHDVGHAIGAISIAARVLGWGCHLLEGLSDGALSGLLGLDAQSGPEAEHPDCLLLVLPAGNTGVWNGTAWRLREEVARAVASRPLHGVPNRLSDDHHLWPVIDDVARAATKTESSGAPTERIGIGARPMSLLRRCSARQIIRQRRSAVEMDGETGLDRDAFYSMLGRVLPAGAIPPFSAWPWEPAVHLALFVHRVRDLAPGLYLLARDESRMAFLRESIGRPFSWRRPVDCPERLPLYMLEEGNFAGAASRICCGQEIAAHGIFAVGMLAELEPRLRETGPWFYRRLFWETGLIGQILYLEAEAAGVRGTGIGCFFDDAMHHQLGITDQTLQSLYHFTVGGPIEDGRLQTRPAYTHRK